MIDGAHDMDSMGRSDYTRSRKCKRLFEHDVDLLVTVPIGDKCLLFFNFELQNKTDNAQL